MAIYINRYVQSYDNITRYYIKYNKINELMNMYIITNSDHDILRLLKFIYNSEKMENVNYDKIENVIRTIELPTDAPMFLTIIKDTLINQW